MSALRHLFLVSCARFRSPPSRDAYDEMASWYDAITAKAIGEHYEWPAIRSLLPPLDGGHVLDAACGDGYYAERLVEPDVTDELREAHPGRATELRDAQPKFLCLRFVKPAGGSR